MALLRRRQKPHLILTHIRQILLSFSFVITLADSNSIIDIQKILRLHCKYLISLTDFVVQDSYALCRVFKKNGICSELETEPQLQTGQCSFTTVSMEINSNNINYSNDYETMSPEVGVSSACLEDVVDDKDDSWMQFITDDAWDTSSNAAAMGHGQGVY